MREKLGFLGYVWFMVCGSCMGNLVVGKKNSFKVTSPDWLKGVYECALKDFRVFGNGGRGSMVGTVVYVGTNQKACRNLDEVAGVFFKSMPRGQRIFLLADQGVSIYNS